MGVNPTSLGPTEMPFAGVIYVRAPTHSFTIPVVRRIDWAQAGSQTALAKERELRREDNALAGSD